MQPVQLSTTTEIENRWCRVRKDRVRWPNGYEGDYFVMEGWTAVGVVAIQDDKILVVKQFRYPIGKNSLEIPMGRANEGEDMAVAAIRELREETGFTAGKITSMGRIFNLNGICNLPFHVFLAQDLSPGDRELDPQEHDLSAEWISTEDWKRLIRENVITDSETLACWAMYLSQ